MSVVADISVDAADFALAATFEACPAATIEVERLAAHPVGRWFPHVWAHGEGGRLERALAADPTTAAVERLTEAGGRTLFAVEWAGAVRERLELLLTGNPVVLSATGRDGRWTFRLRFCDRDGLAALQERLASEVVALDLGRVRTDEAADVGDGPTLTDKQRETLRLALDRGYFEVPREATMTELADELGVSQQAVSKRLRRANATLTRRALATDAGTDSV